MLRIGLTGGIGSGKTTVAKLFEMLGIPVFYADLEAHRIRCEPEISEQIVKKFGNEILVENQIDKHQLANIIFNNDEALQWLNDLLHPLVIAEFEQFAEAHENLETDMIVMESALIFEAHFEDLFDKIIVVDAPEEVRISRVMKRENISKDAVLQRIAKQLPANVKREKADIIIHNNERHSLLEQLSAIILQLKPQC